MAHWRCRCGEILNSILCPDKQSYLAFSEVLWVDICGMTDSNDNINWYDIPNPSFDMYICPYCGRIMIFDDDGHVESYVKESTC